MRTGWLPAALLAAAALAAAPAAALDDLTGFWEGTVVCDRTDDTGSSRTSSPASIQLDDDGAGNAFGYFNNLGVFRFTIVSGADEPQRGRIGGPSCAFSEQTGGSLAHALVKLKPGSEKGSMKGELLTLGLGASPHIVQLCKLKLKRTSLTIPTPIPSCPP